MNTVQANNYFTTTALWLVLILVLFSPVVNSEGVVIVHPSNANALDLKAISKIFLGKKKTFPDGKEAIPLDIKDGDSTRDEFVEKVLKKNNQQIKAYWSQQLFTGRGRPPKEVDGSSAVKKLVSENPSLIGYINAADADSSIKVLNQF